MAEQTQVGIILEGAAQRDAIHIAIAPVVAGEKLVPGSHVGFIKDGNTELVGVRTKETIGVVDPFYKGMIQVGQRFYLFLYPQSITSLKHLWSHPAFKDEVPMGTKKAIDTYKSEQWLRNFLSDGQYPSYETTIETIKEQEDWDHLVVDMSEAYGDIPPEFWSHVEVVLGHPVHNRATYFSCSC